MIREATAQDVGAILELGRAMVAESPTWNRFTFDAERAGPVVESCIESGFAWVGERDGRVCAVFLGMTYPHWACDVVIAHELVLFVEPAARGSTIAARLIAEFATWADENARIACVGTSTKVREELTVRLYERLGFTKSGTTLER